MISDLLSLIVCLVVNKTVFLVAVTNKLRIKTVQMSVRMLAVVVSLSLLWSLVEVHSQTFPYVSFRGQNLANHSYVDLSLVGYGGDSVQCHTDLTTCCSSGQGIHRGDWYFPNGTRLLLPIFANIYESREKKRVDLRRLSATSPTGMYYCDIATVAVHDNETTQLIREIVYVGLHANGGGLC